MKTTLTSLIQKEKFYYVNPDINDTNFPQPEKIEKLTAKNWKLITLDKTYTSEQVLQKIKDEHCRPANVYELLDFKKSKYLRQEIPKGTYKYIVALGSTWKDADGRHGVPNVRCRSDGDFEFALGYFVDVWLDVDAFLCFCDQTLESETLEKPALNSSDPLSLELRVQKLEKIVEGISKVFNK